MNLLEALSRLQVAGAGTPIAEYAAELRLALLRRPPGGRDPVGKDQRMNEIPETPYGASSDEVWRVPGCPQDARSVDSGGFSATDAPAACHCAALLPVVRRWQAARRAYTTGVRFSWSAYASAADALEDALDRTALVGGEGEAHA